MQRLDTETRHAELPRADAERLTGEAVPAQMPLFVGYATLEKWLDTRTKALPAYVLPLVEPGQDQGGLSIDALLVICQQQDERGNVHYCRLRAAEMSRCFGEPFCSDWREREAAWHSYAAAVEGELTARGIPVVAASIAVPRALRPLEGTSETIRFDRASGRYRSA